VAGLVRQGILPVFQAYPGRPQPSPTSVLEIVDPNPTEASGAGRPAPAGSEQQLDAGLLSSLSCAAGRSAVAGPSDPAR